MQRGAAGRVIWGGSWGGQPTAPLTSPPACMRPPTRVTEVAMTIGDTGLPGVNWAFPMNTEIVIESPFYYNSQKKWHGQTSRIRVIRLERGLSGAPPGRCPPPTVLLVLHSFSVP